MIKEKLTAIVASALENAVSSGKLGIVSPMGAPILITRPKQPEHGDYALDLAFKLAGKVKATDGGAKMSPLQIAEVLVAQLKELLGTTADVEIAGKGFINFRLHTPWFTEVLQQVHRHGFDFGRSDQGGGSKVLLEYVSANPTGDLHIGHGRIAVIGSCLANLMQFAGYDVSKEFYVNDAGEQVGQLGRCAWALYQKLAGKEVSYPEQGYPEDSLVGFVEPLFTKYGATLLDLGDEEATKQVGALTQAAILLHQRTLLASAGVSFDNWYSETALHQAGKVDAMLVTLGDAGLTYTEDGALKFKATSFGDTRDRFLTKKEDGSKTYLTADIAYHLDKLERGNSLLINIWGADHYGQVPSLKAALTGLGQNPDDLEVILVQIVNLSKDGQIVRMSKRLGTVVLFSELIDEVGIDAVRYYLAASSTDSAISFDMELAKKTSKENPAYYVQYAHTRCASILRKALEGETPSVSADQWQEYLAQYKNSSQVFEALFDSDPAVAEHQKALIAQLELFPQVVEKAAQTRAVNLIAHYAYDVACDLQKFYETSHVITANVEMTKARLGVIAATKQVLANALAILGISAPERM